MWCVFCDEAFSYNHFAANRTPSCLLPLASFSLHLTEMLIRRDTHTHPLILGCVYDPKLPPKGESVEFLRFVSLALLVITYDCLCVRVPRHPPAPLQSGHISGHVNTWSFVYMASETNQVWSPMFTRQQLLGDVCTTLTRFIFCAPIYPSYLPAGRRWWCSYRAMGKLLENLTFPTNHSVPSFGVGASRHCDGFVVWSWRTVNHYKAIQM